MSDTTNANPDEPEDEPGARRTIGPPQDPAAGSEEEPKPAPKSSSSGSSSSKT